MTRMKLLMRIGELALVVAVISILVYQVYRGRVRAVPLTSGRAHTEPEAIPAVPPTGDRMPASADAIWEQFSYERKYGAGWGRGVVVRDGYVYACGDWGGAGRVERRRSDTGELIWGDVFGQPGSKDVPHGIDLDAAGDIYMAGCHADRDWLVNKYTSSGAPVWTKLYGTGYPSSTGGIAFDVQGNLWVSGFMGHTPGWDGRRLVVKRLDPSTGEENLPEIDLGPTHTDGLGGAVAVKDGVVFVGQGKDVESGKTAVFAQKILLDGTLSWNYSYTGAEPGWMVWALYVDADPAGRICIAASEKSDERKDDILVVVLDPDGRPAPGWEKPISWDAGRGMEDTSHDVAVGADGTIATAGFTIREKDGRRTMDPLMVHFNPDGSVACVIQLDTPFNEDGFGGVAYDATDGGYVTVGRYAPTPYGVTSFCTRKLRPRDR